MIRTEVSPTKIHFKVEDDAAFEESQMCPG